MPCINAGRAVLCECSLRCNFMAGTLRHASSDLIRLQNSLCRTHLPIRSGVRTAKQVDKPGMNQRASVSPATAYCIAASSIALCLPPSLLLAQDNYEIQVYGSETVPRGVTMIELHNNFTAKGAKKTDDGRLPTNHAWHAIATVQWLLASPAQLGWRRARHCILRIPPQERAVGALQAHLSFGAMPIAIL